MWKELKILIMLIVLCWNAVPVWAQTVALDFSEYVGRPMNELLDDLGAPESITQASPPALVLRYADADGQTPMRFYNVDFVVTGPWVEVVRVAARDAGGEPSVSIEPSGLIAFIGETRAEMTALAGAARERVAFEWDGLLLENTAFDIDMAGEPWRLTCNLENGRVVTVTCQYGGEMQADKVRDFVLQLDALVLALLHEPVWCLDDAGYDATDPAKNRWRYNRLAADERFGVMLLTRATPETGHLFLDLTISDLNARGFVAREFAASHMLAIADNWYKETSRYINSGNTVRLKALLEQRSGR